MTQVSKIKVIVRVLRKTLKEVPTKELINIAYQIVVALEKSDKVTNNE